jgi:hypothetical protein
MQPYRNPFWVSSLTVYLPGVIMQERDRIPCLVHRSGLTISLHLEKERLRFSVQPVYATVGEKYICPDAPPPITVDPRRAVKRIAAEVQRRLLDPALAWYPDALAWQQEREAHYQAQQATRAAFTQLGGHPHTDYSSVVTGPSWRAQIDSAESVTLNLTSVPADKALAIVQMLTA